MIPFVNLRTQQEKIKTDLDRRLSDVLAHGNYIMGPEVNELEKKLADYVGVKHCVSVGNGTDALMIALMAIGIKPCDEVIMTPFTFIATAEAAALLGARPVFVDIDKKTYNLDAAKLEKAITKKTRAIIPISLYGQCADMDAINAIAEKYNISVIEDGAQSFGAQYKGRRSCSLSTIGCTSFFPTKPLGCYGDGGACFTNDDLLGKMMRECRAHGQNRRYHHVTVGVNSRLDTLQAAVLLAKLEIFDQEIQRRIEVGEKYNKGLKDAVRIPFIERNNICVYAQYTIQVNNRAKVQEALKLEGIPTAVHYPIPLHMQPVFAYLGINKGSFPVSEEAAQKVLSLPIGAWLSEDEQDKVICHVIKNVTLED